jgi:hypothetical protein
MANTIHPMIVEARALLTEYAGYLFMDETGLRRVIGANFYRRAVEPLVPLIRTLNDYDEQQTFSQISRKMTVPVEKLQM